MTNSANQHTRREVLTWLASIPFLPLGAMATSATLAGCNDDDKDTVQPINPAKLKTATFTPMDAPTLANPAAMATTTVASSLAVTWDDNTKTVYKLAYKTFFQTGDLVSDGKGSKILAGGYYDINNKLIMDNFKKKKKKEH